jgi:hypothetical protein
VGEVGEGGRCASWRELAFELDEPRPSASYIVSAGRCLTGLCGGVGRGAMWEKWRANGGVMRDMARARLN